MSAREWMMSDRNLADDPIESFTDISGEERECLALLARQCRGWSDQNIDEVVAVMAEDGTYHDITLPPAIGHAAIREFGAGFRALPRWEATMWAVLLCLSSLAVILMWVKLVTALLASL